MDIDNEDTVNDVIDDVELDALDGGIHRMMYLMYHQFQGFQFLNQASPRSFANMLRIPFRTSKLCGVEWVNELLQGHPQRFYDALRLDKCTFRLLCDKVVETGRLLEHQRTKVCVEESVVIFLHTIRIHQQHRHAAERFEHSPETISRHVHIVCGALCDMAPAYICPPNFNTVPDFIANNPQLHPFFKDCVGIIDGTIVPAWTSVGVRGSYRCRKGHLAQNNLAACDFNLQFTFVLASWEGSANDARIIVDALTQPQYDFPWPPQDDSLGFVITIVSCFFHFGCTSHNICVSLNGKNHIGKYYVVDSGFTNFPGFLAPYRGKRYHIPEWTKANREPNTIKELFNRRHATVRNHIERCFGALKKRFPMLRGLMPNYLLDTQADIVIGCCVIHNFVKKHTVHDQVFQKVANPDLWMMRKKRWLLLQTQTIE